MEQKNDGIVESIKMFFSKITGTNDYTSRYKEKEIEDNKGFAFLSDVIPFIPFIVERNSKYVCFHSNQGMNCLVWFLLMFAFSKVMEVGFNGSPLVGTFRMIVTLIYIVLCVIGIIHVLNNRAREIPVLSKVNIISFCAGLFGK